AWYWADVPGESHRPDRADAGRWSLAPLAPSRRSDHCPDVRHIRPRARRAAGEGARPPPARSCLDLELPHHPHVLLLDVVAVEHKAERSASRLERRFSWVVEFDEDPDLAADISTDEDGILAPPFQHRRGAAVAREDEEVAEMDVDGVDPATTRFEGPDLRFSDPRSSVDTVLVEELSVDLPCSVRAVELEGALHLDLRQQLRWSHRHREETGRYTARV